MTATTRSGFDIFRSILCQSFGCGVKTKFPRVADIDKNLLNPKYIVTDSTVNLVDHVCSNLEQDEVGGHTANVDAAGGTSRPNIIKMENDRAQGISKTSFMFLHCPLGGLFLLWM